MVLRTLNLGILAHVDAGKTSLTERILFETGVIQKLGRVDHGTTQTDTLDLERQRGITIQTAVASFCLGDLQVNLIDTPGHSDFIAEVDRALQVLDAVILVVSAVEGVQAQTRKLARAIKAAGLPLVIFVNKIDRAGARTDELIEDIEHWLDVRTVTRSRASEVGSRDARVGLSALGETVLTKLAENDDALLARYLDGESTPDTDLMNALADQTREQKVVPLFFGTATVGTGVNILLDALPELIGNLPRPIDGELSGLAFKVQRAVTNEKVGLFRLYRGSVTVRDVIQIADPRGKVQETRITALELARPGGFVRDTEAHAGDIVRIHGIDEVRVGDAIGDPAAVPGARRFPPPTLESVIHPLDIAQKAKLYEALMDLESQDPMISVRRGERDATVSLRLYGEVQKEVITATLADVYRVAVEFEPSQVICIERVKGSGAAGETLGQGSPFMATVHLELQSNPIGKGVTYWAKPGALDHSFYNAIEETTHKTLEEGLFGWEIPDIDIRVPLVGMSPGSVAMDYRNLVPLVLTDALKQAGTEVCEPMDRFTLEVPVDFVGEAYSLLASADAIPENMTTIGELARIFGEIPLAEVQGLEQLLPGLARGRAMFALEHAGYRPVRGEPPVRERTDFNPLNRKEYLARLSQN